MSVNFDFGFEAPEKIVALYGGDKLKIRQAVEQGSLHPTPAVLAGMLIDAGAREQAMKAGQTPTVAQQVLGGGGPPMPPAQQGLGSIPSPVPPPPPQMQPEMQAPQGMAPQGMAMGGLVGLPVPDAMFDEPTNGGFDDGYAGGGLVAFSDGGPTNVTNWGTYIEDMLYKLDPDIEISGRARTPARNTEVGGVANSYHMIDAARDVRVPKGMDKPTFISQLKSVFGSDYDILPSKGNSVHIEPGPELGKKVRAGAAPSNAPAQAPERDTATAEGRFMSAQDSMAFGRGLMGNLPREELERARKYALEELDPATQEKQVKADMWQTLAEIGFNMASSKSPYVLQAIGEAAAAAMPGARADKKERKAAKDTAIRTLMAVEDVDRKTAMAGVELGMDVYKTGMSAEQAERAMAFQKSESALDRTLQREIENARAARTPTSDLETMIAIQQSGTPEQKAALIETLKLKQQYASSGNAAAGSIEGVLGLDGGGAKENPYAGFSATRN